MARTTTRKTTSAGSTRSRSTKKTTTTGTSATKAATKTATTAKTTAKSTAAKVAPKAAEAIAEPAAKPIAESTTAPVAAESAVSATSDSPIENAEAGIKKKDLIERVAEMSGLKKPDVKPVVEATLAIIGEALSKGESLNLEPLGKMKVQRQKELANATVISCRVRRKKDQPDGQPNEPLAEAAE